jgi:DNA-binding MltR family transcriptional regulator
MIMNPFKQNEHLLHFLTSQVEQEVIDYIRQEMQHDATDSVPTEEELLTFFQSPDKPTKLDAYQQMLATDKLLEYAEISLRTLCDLIRYQQLKESGVVHSAKEFIQLFRPDEQEDTP